MRTLTLCRDAADIDLGEVDYELCHRTWPPLAVDIALLIGAILVLFSWGGLLRYVDRGPKLPNAKDIGSDMF